MRALITGAAGFIGSNLFRRCRKEGWLTVGVDDLSNGHLKFITDVLDDKNSCIIASFDNESVLADVRTGKYDVVFHIAAVPRVGYSVEHPLETNDVNVTRTLSLMEAAKEAKVRFVFASSSSVYGDRVTLPAKESSEKHPQSPYALQKSIIEDYLSLYHDLYGLESVSLRFFNVFGPNQLGSSPYATAVSSWLTAIFKGQKMRKDGTGLQSRDMCYVDNVVDACILAATTPLSSMTGNRRYNVACGDSVSNNEIIQFLMNRFPSSGVEFAPPRKGDVMHTLADISRAQSELGYEPRVRFWEGLERTIEWAENSPLFLTLDLKRG